MSPAAMTMDIDGHRLRLTSPTKVMYPAAGTTKRDVVDYYQRIAPVMLPHCEGRPATRKRWPGGVGTEDQPGEVFFQKNLGAGTPEWIERVTIQHSDHSNDYPLINNAASLAWLAQISSLEVHVPQWRVGPDGTPRNPDRFVLDLDPGEGVGLAECVEVAKLARSILDDVGLECVPVTSGSKGIHLYAGLTGDHGIDDVSAFAHELARSLESDHPDLVVSRMAKALRPGKVFVDWSQNNVNKTTVAPYSLRGRARPMVAAPRTWRELTHPRLRQLEMGEVLDRVRRRGDPMAEISDPTSPAPAGREQLSIARERSGDQDSPSRTSGRRLPSFVPPMLATLSDAEELTSPRRWAVEMKWDGIRAIVAVAGNEVRIYSRNAKSITPRYPELAALPRASRASSVLLDGEIVAFNSRGMPDFALLQQRMNTTGAADIDRLRGQIPVRFMAFDILELDGRDLTGLSYDDRRRLLEGAIGDDASDYVDVPPAFDGDVQAAIDASRQWQLEGVVAKRKDSRYLPGRRSSSWLKIKHSRTQEVVVIGWRAGQGRRHGIVGSLLLAVPDGEGWRYVGKVGTGFSEQEARDWVASFERIARKTAPATVPAGEDDGVQWVSPKRVAEVAFSEWTPSGRMRHPRWRGWRTDKSAAEIT
ncbi:MAG TPA: non-homologous end-joining DNA ligase [Actinomycetaceae bacterium]|nr:non-homologous end-joining DNA ligase [Actinomycetaceae bacterium]